MFLDKYFWYLVKICPFLLGENPWHNLEWDWWFKGIQGAGSRRFWKDVLCISEAPGRRELFHTFSVLKFWRRNEYITVLWALAPCSQAASLDALPLFKKSEDQKNLGWTHRAWPKLLIWAHFIFMGSSQRQHLPTGNALVNVSSHWLPKALELYNYICMSNFLFLPFIQRKMALVAWVLSKVTVLAVFYFVCFFLKHPTAWTG